MGKYYHIYITGFFLQDYRGTGYMMLTWLENPSSRVLFSFQKQTLLVEEIFPRKHIY